MTTDNPQYWFASDYLYFKEGSPRPKEMLNPQRVERMTKLCHNVRHVGNGNFMGSNTWDFQIVGDDATWYRTHYDWALVLNTPENLERVKAWLDKRKEIDALEREEKKLFKAITNVPVPEREAET